jgi:FAD:protein FMN transferase
MQLEFFQRVRPGLGTLVAIEATAESESQGLAAIDEAFEAIERIAALMHPTTDDSDLKRVSSAPLGERVHVHPWTFAVLEIARELHALTAGIFDPCLPGKPGRLTDLDLTVRDHVALGAPAAIDLGGIAKGFAVDRAIDTLQAHGCLAGLVNAGGDVRVYGGTARPIVVRLATGGVAQIELANAALAVSGPRSIGSPPEHRGYYLGSTHEFVTGRTIAITAAKAVIADALTKCAMLCPTATAEIVLRKYGARRLEIVCLEIASDT